MTAPFTAAAWVLALVTLASTGSTPPVSAALVADQIAILANRNSPGSAAVAGHYAHQRRIPVEHIIQLDLPTQETISRQAYEQAIVQPVRRALIARRMAPRIRVPVTTYGVPLRVQAPPPRRTSNGGARMPGHGHGLPKPI